MIFSYLHQKKISKKYSGLMIPLALGALAFLIVVGINPLDPQNIAWLDGGYDPSLHYLAWEFYRLSPWTNPVGLNPNYGLDIASSIVYSDSIPLFGIFFKLFSAYLSVPFQYIGIWLLICFILQGYLAWYLVRIYSADNVLLSLTTLFFLFSPPMLWRLGEHAALFGHFLIVGSLYLALRKNQDWRILLWTILVASSFLVNIYIATPILFIWFADLLDKRKNDRDVNSIQMLIEILCVSIILIITLWQSGYLSVGAGSASGRDYGFRQLNLLALFNSSGWSYIFNPIPLAHPGFEGFNYLGLGILLLLPFAIFKIYTKKLAEKLFLSQHLFLILCFICLILFAISNNISFGPWQFKIELPELVLSSFGMLRSSGRIFWPIYYFLLLLIVVGTIWGYSRSQSIILLSVALCFQVIDTSAGWLPKKFLLNQAYSSDWKLYLRDPLWRDFSTKYHQILETPLVRSVLLLPEGWQIFAKYAAQNKMGTNSIYIGRYDDSKLAAANAKYEAAIASGNYDPEALYIIDDERVMPVLMHLDPKKHLFAKIDGFNVLAPGWVACVSCAQPSKEALISKTYPKIRTNEPIGFGKGQVGTAFLIGIDQRQIKGWGWAYPESWGVWTEGPKSKVVLPIPQGNPKTLTMNFRAFITAAHPKQTVEVLVNNQFVQSVIFIKDQNNQIIINIPQDNNLGFIAIELRLPDAISPKDLRIGEDIRPLGVGLVRAEFR